MKKGDLVLWKLNAELLRDNDLQAKIKEELKLI